MKKHMIIAAVAAASLAAFSCTGVEQEIDTNDGVLVLKLDGGEMETRADDAEPSLETAIDHFDYFFFSDAEGTTAIDGMHGRAEGDTKILDCQEGKEFAPLRSITSYVYILANYPTELDHSHNWTLADILALDVTSQILKEKKKAENPITHEMEETGEVVFTDNLVMDSWRVENDADVYTVQLTPAKIQEEREVKVSLARLAAKLTVDITITPSVTIAGYVWESHPELLKAYFVNALNNKTDMKATPVKRSALTDESLYEYQTYPTAYTMTPDPVAGVYEYKTDPIYTYPQEWTSDDNGEPYFKFQIPWLNQNEIDEDDPDADLSMGSSTFYYKVTVPNPDTDGKWTLERNKWYQVSVTLSMLNPQEDYADLNFDCTIVDWADSGWKGGNDMASAKFFDVPVREFTMYSDELLEIPYSSSSTVTAYFEEVSYWYYGSANGTHYHFRKDYPTEKVSQWTLPTNQDSDGQTLNVKDCWGSNTNAAKDLNEYKLEADGKFVKFTHSLDEIFSVRTIKVVLVNQDGRSAEVIITQHPAIEVKKHPTQNAFLSGYYNLGDGTVCDADGNLTGYGHQTTYITKGYYYRSRTGWSGTYGAYGSLYAGGSTTVASDHYFTTEVSVSAFSEDNNKYTVKDVDDGNAIKEFSYRLGDPRVPASTHYNSSTSSGTPPRFVLRRYLYSDKARRQDNGDGTYTQLTDASADVTRAWEEPLKILIGSQNLDDRNVIAPRFLVSSSMNITDGVYWNNSDGSGIVQRCAMYQEAGYPAGRWRLPTEAEFAFMMKLQGEGYLPMLFANCYYRTADGRGILVNSSNRESPQVATRANSTNTKVYIRMVYDLWYWGDDPTEDALNYHPESEMTDWEKAMSEDGVTPNWKAHWADYFHPNMHEH